MLCFDSFVLCFTNVDLCFTNIVLCFKNCLLCLQIWATVQNDSCPSHETNLAFPTTEKSRAFVVNRASVLGFRAIGGGHVTASKVFSFLGQYTWNDNFELTNL